MVNDSLTTIRYHSAMKAGSKLVRFGHGCCLAISLGLYTCANATAEDHILPDASRLEQRQSEARATYERIAGEMAISAERETALKAEIAALNQDSDAITRTLVESARKEKQLSDEVAAHSRQIKDLNFQQDALRLSLRSRRSLLAEVLAALQRMGLNPPPAILIKPEDALGSVRSAILLGAVVPELRSETLILLGDLKELGRLRTTIGKQRELLEGSIRDQLAERQRLNALLEEKRALRKETESEIAAEQQKAEQLASRATSMQNLIASLESEIGSVRKARQQLEEQQKIAEQKAEEIKRLREQEKPVPEANRLVGALPFDALKNKLLLPVSGRLEHRFGENSPNGLHYTGDTVKTQSGAIVTALSDGVILFSGQFRSYGQLLILDAGDGYHIVMAGMARLNVRQGQKVLSGEPVGVMGDKRVAAIAQLPGGTMEPELYIEFRKDKKPVDPIAWWSDTVAGRKTNDT